jgi:DNA-binding response OmpR family regulator
MAVGDNKGILCDIVGYLRRSNCECTHFTDAQKAVDILGRDVSWNLALLNIGFSEPTGMDGFTLLAHLKQYGVPVVCLTEPEDIHSEIKALNGGAEDCVSRSADFRMLMTRVEKILKCHDKQRILCLGNLRLDPGSQIVCMDRREIQLNQKEFKLFYLLAKNPDRTLLYNEILDEGWGDDYFNGVRTVHEHIRRLRKKLGDREIIVTVAKRGYRLNLSHKQLQQQYGADSSLEQEFL